MLPLKCNGRRRKIDPRHLEHPRFYTKEGWLTPYALACGYIEQKDYGPVRISLFRDGYAYYVKAYDHEQKIWCFLEAFRTLTEARRHYKYAAALLVAGDSRSPVED